MWWHAVVVDGLNPFAVVDDANGLTTFFLSKNGVGEKPIARPIQMNKNKHRSLATRVLSRGEGTDVTSCLYNENVGN